MHIVNKRIKKIVDFTQCIKTDTPSVANVFHVRIRVFKVRGNNIASKLEGFSLFSWRHELTFLEKQNLIYVHEH